MLAQGGFHALYMFPLLYGGARCSHSVAAGSGISGEAGNPSVAVPRGAAAP